MNQVYHRPIEKGKIVGLSSTPSCKRCRSELSLCSPKCYPSLPPSRYDLVDDGACLLLLPWVYQDWTR